MLYKVEINPEKESEFLQLLRVWQSLDVVWSFKSLLETLNEQDMEASYAAAWEKLKAKTGREIGEEYRDLVD